MVLGKLPPPPSPNSNANPKPNPDPDKVLCKFFIVLTIVTHDSLWTEKLITKQTRGISHFSLHYLFHSEFITEAATEISSSK